MKQAGTGTTTEILLYDVIGGASPKPIIKTEYYSDAVSTWIPFDYDLESRSIEISTENKRYQSYSFMPPVKTMNMVINNYGQLYSTGAGDAKSSILKKNLPIRCFSGYELNTSSTASVVDDLTNLSKYVHAQTSGTAVTLDISSYTGTMAPGVLSPLYGATVYSGATYAYPGYYGKTFRLFDYEKPGNIAIQVNSNKFSFKYREGKTKNFVNAPWSNFATLSTGTNNFSLSKHRDVNYIETITRFNTNVWSTADEINNITMDYSSYGLLFKRGTYILDEPIYADKVNATGRDKLRKALETEINSPKLTEVKTVQSRFTEVLDRCNIDYDTNDWDTISTTASIANATIAETLNNTSAWKFCDLLMDAINAGSDDIYFRFDEDGKAVIKKLETDKETDWVTHYKFNIENVSKNFDSETQLQRVTCVNKDITVEAEELLKTAITGSAVSSSLHVTYGTTAMYVRYTDSLGGIVSETNRTNTAIDFEVKEGQPHTILIYGCHPKNITDQIWAEAGNAENILNNNGSTYKRINPFMDSVKAKAYADYIISRNADPKYKMTVTQQANPLLEVGIDNIMVFDKYTFTDNIYGLNSISEKWNNPSLKESIVLRDRGFDLGALIWDRNGYDPGINDLKWDIGFTWDLDLGPNATEDPTDYENKKEVQFA